MGDRNYELLLQRYLLTFDEGFPTEMAPGSSEDHMDIMEKCLSEKKPYDPYANGEVNPNALY